MGNAGTRTRLRALIAFFYALIAIEPVGVH